MAVLMDSKFSFYSRSAQVINRFIWLFSNIYKNAECNSDPHSSCTVQTGKVTHFLVTTTKQESKQNAKKLHYWAFLRFNSFPTWFDSPDLNSSFLKKNTLEKSLYAPDFRGWAAETNEELHNLEGWGTLSDMGSPCSLFDTLTASCTYT